MKYLLKIPFESIARKIYFHRIAMVIGVLLTILGNNGCATFDTISHATTGSPKVYSGTRLDIHAIFNERDNELKYLKKFSRSNEMKPPKRPIADLPFSFFLDSLIFPLTSSVALYEVVFE